MASNSFELMKEGTDGNILFVGKGEALIKSIIQHIPSNYSMAVSQSVDVVLDCAVEEFSPSLIVVCLLDETAEMMRAYSPLSNKSEYINIPVFVVGKEEDCDLFKKNVFSNQIELFKRPFDRERFHARVADVVKKVAPPLADSNAAASFNDYTASAEEAVSNGKVIGEKELFSIERTLMEKIKRMTVTEGKKTVLVVDDDVRMLNIIKLYLQDIYNVIVVPSGTLALKYLAKKKADVVLLDYVMPEMDGPAVLKEIREKSPCPTIPVIFLTGVSDKDMVLRCIELKPSGYLLKPVSRETLLEKVTEVALGL